MQPARPYPGCRYLVEQGNDGSLYPQPLSSGRIHADFRLADGLAGDIIGCSSDMARC